MREIAVVSGKGGVGKSTVAASLAVALAGKGTVICADCDADAPNLAVVAGIHERQVESVKASTLASIDQQKCTRCGACMARCQFRAIAHDKGYTVRPYLCEGCKTCTLVCPANAISLQKVTNADIFEGRGHGFSTVTGRLRPGHSGSGKVVNAVKQRARGRKADYLIVDAAAGIGCPVIASLTGSHFALVVTEPTPTAFADLKRVLWQVRHFQMPHALILNKADLNSRSAAAVRRYARRHSIPLRAALPYDKAFVEAIVSTTPIIKYDARYRQVFMDIAEHIR